jgi:hypothetical protein
VTGCDATSSPTEPRSDADTARELSETAKRQAQQRLKIKKKNLQEMESCEIEHSDDSDSEYDFHNYAKSDAPHDKWRLPTKDFWEPQNNTNRKFRAPRTRPELSHSLTQNEIFAHYPIAKKPLPFGCIKILRRAKLYMTQAIARRLIGVASHKPSNTTWILPAWMI